VITLEADGATMIDYPTITIGSRIELARGFGNVVFKIISWLIIYIISWNSSCTYLNVSNKEVYYENN